MRQIADARLEHQRRRFMRHDAQRWWRCDAERYRRFDPRFQRGGSRFEDKAWADQPRVPAGSSEGGQWTSGGGGETPVHLAAMDKPLRALIAIAARLGKQLIEAYRTENRLRDLFGKKVGTAAVTSLDDKYIFGFNSGIADFSGQYTASDLAAANELRDRMLEKYPDVMASDNVGSMPNNALFHAETTVLLRAWRENGGTLEGRDLIVFVDSMLCRSCNTVLPKVGLELGNPRITFVGPTGLIRTMKDGRWLD